MNKQIEKIALEAGFHSDKFGLYWDQDANSEGVDLEQFAELIIEHCLAQCVDRLSRQFIASHFGVEE